MMMPPDRPDGAGLWALCPLFFNKGYFGPDLQVVEPFVQDAVAMKVDLPAVRRRKEAVTFLGKELADAGMGCGLKGLHGAPPAAHVILQPPAGRVEGVPNGHMDVFVLRVFTRLAGHHDLL